MNTSRFIPCKVTVEGSTEQFDALDTGESWNGWFSGFVLRENKIKKVLQDAGENLAALNKAGVRVYGKDWINVHGLCFRKVEAME